MTLSPAPMPFTNEPRPPVDAQARVGEYALFARSVRESGTRTKVIYFFSRVTPASGVPTAIPPGYEVVHLASGPTLRRRRRAL
jgi:hypothetical protein